ncbi:ATP-binding cassette domain-containing protein [Sciscionella marina]|uniref:ATP-binding cassette domain-containing protein n=1 Tax=Sciscionella marina TaxID=508770 RepID=UPI0003713E28|nr:ABC transporter ATP-binding protein [Sciscionella marina]
MNPLLNIENLRVDFQLADGVVHAVRGIDIHVGAGEIVAVVGESGSGKSATALSVLRLNPQPPCVYAGGSIEFDGRSLLDLEERELRTVRGNEIAMVFQDPMTSLNPVKRVDAQVAEVLRKHKGASRTEALAAVPEALAEAGIDKPEQRARKYPHELSGGLRQRVMIAMALVGRPRLLIADEPTTALDVTVQARILDLLAELRANHGMAILLITHDLGVVAELADRVVVCRDGVVVESGATERVFEEPEDEYTRRLLAATPRLEVSP